MHRVSPFVAKCHEQILEYGNVMEFYNWILSLRPKDVKDKGISKLALWKIKDKIRYGLTLNSKTKIITILIALYK